MNITHGMDVSGVRQLAGLLMTKADEIETIAGTLTTQLGNTAWNGPDADAFRSDWGSTYQMQLTTVANALRDAAGRANSNASQQEQVSSS